MKTNEARWLNVRIAGAILLLLGLVGYVVLNAKFAGYSAVAQGHVSQVEEKQESGRKNSSTYHYKIIYTAEDGSIHDVWESGGHSTNAYSKGDSVRVRYDPSDPDRGCAIEQEQGEKSARILATMALVFGALLLAVSLLGNYASQRSALGIPLPKNVKIAIVAVVVLAVAGVVVFLVRSHLDTQDTQTSYADVTSGSSIGREQIEITQAGETRSGLFSRVGSGKVKGYLIVRNTSEMTLDMTARFSYQTEYHKQIDTAQDAVVAVAPGEVALLRPVGIVSEAKYVGYTLSADRTEPTRASIADRVSIEEKEVGDKRLAITVTNTSSDTVNLEDLRVEGVGGKGEYCACDGNAVATLEPATSVDVVFDANNVYEPKAFTSWNDVERTYYPVGYATVEAEPVEAEPARAVRVPSEQLAVSEVGQTLTGTIDGAGPRLAKCFLIVQNAADKPVSLSAIFSGEDAAGKTAEEMSGTDTAQSVAPGEYAVLYLHSANNDIARVSYEVTSEEPKSGLKPLAGAVQVQEVKDADAPIKVILTNTGSDEAQIFDVFCVAKDAEGNTYAAHNDLSSKIAPGKTIEALFWRDDFFDGDSVEFWDSLDHTYLVNGYIV